MRKKYLILAGLLLSVQILSAVPAAAEEKNTEEAQIEEAAEEESEEAEEESSEENIEETEAADAANKRPEYDYHDFMKELGAYEGLTTEVSPLTEVTEEMIMEEIDARMAENLEVLTEGTVETGDVANIDYQGKKDGVAFDGGTAAGYDLTIGSGQFIPGFEDGLIGVAIGDTVDLNLTFPEQYQAAELAGAEVVFTVTVNSVKRVSEFSDEAAERISDGEYKDMESYKNAVKAELENQVKEQQKAEAEAAFWDMIVDATVFEELPEDVLEFDTAANVTYYRNMLYYYYGMTLEDYCAMDGSTVEDYETMIHENMEKNLKYEIVEQAILEAEGIELSEDVYNECVKKYAEQYGYDEEQFLTIANEWDIWKSIFYEKSAEIVLAKNQFTEREGE